MIRIALTLVFALATLALQAQPQSVFPISVWYGGGKARAPMLESGARTKKELWRQDVRQIKALGFNTLRAWIDWATGEPAEKRYNFETLDVLLELAQEEGLHLLVQVYMDSAPQWVGEKYPDARFVSAGGEVIQPESAPGYCRDHAGVRAADRAFYTALADHLKRSPAFLGFDLWSEPHVINWATPVFIEKPEFCYCPNTLARFRTWLQTKYGSLDHLNTAWYRQYHSWDQVEPGRFSTILSFTDYIDWKAFIVDKLGQDLRDRADAAKHAAPDRLAASHAAGVGLFASPHHWEGQSDDWTMAGQVDYYGTSFYPKHSAFIDRDVPWRAALLDFTRSFGFDAGRKGFWIGELQGGFGTIALNVSPTVTPEDIRIWTWSALARGAKAINYYAWYPMSSGYESGGFGLNQLDGTITARAREAGSIARVVDRNQKLFLDARPPQAEVAILYNPLSHFVGGRQRAAVYGGPQGEVAGIERDSLLGIHRALFSTNVPIDFIHIAHLTPEKLRQYKLVYFPYPLMMPEAPAQLLRAYVAAGGALVAEARLGWMNEGGKASDRIPGMGLWELMGCRETAIQTAPKGRTVIHWASTAFPGLQSGDALPGTWFEESLEPLGPASRVVARYVNGDAAAVASTFGRGRTLMLGSYLSAAYQTTPTAASARFFDSLLAWSGVTRPVQTANAEVRWLESGPDRLVFVLNHSAKPVESIVRLRVPGGNLQAVDLINPGTVALQSLPQVVEFSVHLEPNAVRVLRLSPRP
ncbi:beta-galactosidase [uncultured Paludibaculum sp.]|uniref:beta-galactosidase n=1 Tax=uncultured Paludibaculum sp. TaxID=1765020 RepID=UPI002AAADB4F|nr:beta-galactosidase [uncultured Paludibaculum sp.]